MTKTDKIDKQEKQGGSELLIKIFVVYSNISTLALYGIRLFLKYTLWKLLAEWFQTNGFLKPVFQISIYCI